MPHNKPSSLLPAGLYDLLPPHAAHERQVSGRLLDVFERFGYAQVSPPLMEFEASLLSGRGEALAPQTFRVMDPLSQDMLGFRPDITMQVARIAAARMAEAPRPLRVSYGGSTLRVKGDGTERSRQLRQAGMELIGSPAPSADAEVIAVAITALRDIGCEEVVVDINLPGLVGHVLEEEQVDTTQRDGIGAAMECKDAGWIADAGLGETGDTLIALIQASGPLDDGLAKLSRLKLPTPATEQLEHVSKVAQQLDALGVKVTLTIDAVENRGFEYHSLISFSLFSPAARGEIGRGGRYISAESGEPATGVTLYVNILMEMLPVSPAKPRVLVPQDLPLAEYAALQQQGFVTIRADGMDIEKRAAGQHGCSHVWRNGKAEKLKE